MLEVDGMRANDRMDNVEVRAKVALMMDAGVARDEAQRLVDVLAKANVLRTDLAIQHIHVTDRLGEDPAIDVRFEDGRRYSGRIANDVVLQSAASLFSEEACRRMSKAEREAQDEWWDA